MSTITLYDAEVEAAEEQEGEKPETEPEIFSLPQEEIDRILAAERARPERPPDPCLLEDSSEDGEEEPMTEYQDSMDAAGYPYW